MSEFTSKPWCVDRTTYRIDKWHETQVIKNGRVIAVVRDPEAGQCRTNAHLVAAAPELYAALMDAAELLNVAMEKLGVCGEGDGRGRNADAEFPGGVSALHAARKAIAKASGQ